VSLEEFDVALPRHAFGPRETARAGEVWRALQQGAVIGSSRRGWPPARYREVGAAFVVRTMTVRHHRETAYGELTRVRTWVSGFQREMFSTRQLRLLVDGHAVTSATQRWVHVRVPDLKPARACAELVSAFVVEEHGESVATPEVVESLEGPAQRLNFAAWHTWMDPLAHANHPAYVDWADEAIARRIAAAGGNPQGVVAHAETVTFRSGVRAPEEVTVQSQLRGRDADGNAVISLTITGHDGRCCADVLVVRSLAEGGGAPLVEALSAG